MKLNHWSAVGLQTAAQLLELLQTRDRMPVLPTRLPEIDALQGGGFHRGTLVQVCGPVTSGRMTIALAALATATQGGEAASLIEPAAHFDPQAAHVAGIQLDRLLWTRPKGIQESFLSAELSLATGFSLVVLDLALLNSLPRYFPSAVWARLARAAEEHQGIFIAVVPKGFPHPYCHVRIETELVSTQQMGADLLSNFRVHVTVHKRGGGVQAGNVTFFTREALGR